MELCRENTGASMGGRCLRCVSFVEFPALPAMARLRNSLGSGFRRKGKCVLERGGPWHRSVPQAHSGWGASAPISPVELSQEAWILRPCHWRMCSLLLSFPPTPDPLGPCTPGHLPGAACPLTVPPSRVFEWWLASHSVWSCCPYGPRSLSGHHNNNKNRVPK